MRYDCPPNGWRLSRGVVRVVAACYVFGYLVLYRNAAALLPEFIFRDAEKIQAQMGGADTFSDTSFDAVGKLYGWLGGGVDAVVASIGACFIWAMLRSANRFRSMVAAFVLSSPCVFFNLFVASKDTLVVLMSLIVAWAARRFKVRGTLVATLAPYGVYACFIRSYFALIAAIALTCVVFRLLSLRGQLVLCAAAGLIFALLPDWAYYALLHPRDMAVDYLVYESPFGARTSFYNPVDPSSLYGFIIDYLYAIGRLNLAPLFSPGPKEVVMQIFVALAVAPALRVLRCRRATVGSPSDIVLASLVFGHIAVSMLFEPDLGSYIRHLSSIALLSMSLLVPYAQPRQSTPSLASASRGAG
ncbi:hypothetical protein [Burkholderia stagnalis]|uniref:hypothetical protein n=1 Tax=Burkholderia stagnalis TaxID=1503054 RepID=UPI00075AE596|nr:hypothetical protein [Burkholderia stagnalis]KWI26332.1 hypothetical protein WT71_19955 [Burkholderia stagnalis]KWI71368.1 hypothetical protein WT73_00940 [Burkholderia stagnalis]MDY7804184.1 hypothetical protein [Burkholderia stagnalis]